MNTECVRILLLESDAGISCTVEELLSGPEWEVHTVRDLGAAEKALLEKAFDVVLTAPAGAGPVSLDHLPPLVSASANLPLLLLSKSRDPATLEQAVRLGAHDCVFLGDLDSLSLGRCIRLAREYRRVQLENARLTEEAARVHRARDEFLAVLSHELRTPLTSILGWTVLLRDGRLPAETAAKALGAIEQNARDQGRLIDDLLDLSHIITGRLKLGVGPVHLAALMQAAVESVRVAADAKEVRVQCELASDVPVLSGDAGRLQQVVWNLLINAVKFTPRGGNIHVRLRGADGHAEISVSDNGIGIPADTLPHIFERFRQADSSAAREHGGLGLGLAIVRYLVEMHGGTVQAVSAGTGKGASFTLRLPLPEPAKSAVAS
jgi:signal transduction histidine kinase